MSHPAEHCEQKRRAQLQQQQLYCTVFSASTEHASFQTTIYV
jgi:hypothetical protein